MGYRVGLRREKPPDICPTAFHRKNRWIYGGFYDKCIAQPMNIWVQ